jgi:sterile alpha motif and leucine zipper containing kinase AZK
VVRISASARFKTFSVMCSQLDHPNIVGFVGAVTEPSNLCIITQYCARGSLADLLLEPRYDHNLVDVLTSDFLCSVPMDYVRKLKFARDAARGMLYLHSSNPVILHRDLKSDNLLVAQVAIKFAAGAKCCAAGLDCEGG